MFQQFLKIAYFLERILMKNIELICSLESKLTLIPICSIRISSGNLDNIEKPMKAYLKTPMYFRRNDSRRSFSVVKSKTDFDFGLIGSGKWCHVSIDVSLAPSMVFIPIKIDETSTAREIAVRVAQQENGFYRLFEHSDHFKSYLIRTVLKLRFEWYKN